MAVVMARGASSRMGTPKGMVVLPDDSRPMLARVVDLYLELDIPIVVVARWDTASIYGKILGESQAVEMVSAEPGGGTARTLAIAWEMFQNRCSHLWAHPVDLPMVRASTLERLSGFSLAEPEMVIRPTHLSTPGHPVILPSKALGKLAESQKFSEFEGDMKELLAAAGPAGKGLELEEVEVSDPGVIRDFDTMHIE
ncbi:MAG: NTP transferase domain-containing protein [Gemmatimonadales bacterium]|nr:NTP transferase domain-containing protein [Gemmatimonadales bacterium]